MSCPASGVKRNKKVQIYAIDLSAWCVYPKAHRICGLDLADGQTLAALIESLGMKPDRVAVERNRQLAPRNTWLETALQPGDQLEIVHFVGGGCE